MTKLYKTAKDISEKNWDAIIIGSGIGGLTAAASLARNGYKCLVLEQHYVPGGFTHAFQRKGFEWDVGVHAVGDVHPKAQVGRIFNYISEDRLKWEFFGDTYETFRFPGGETFEFPSDKNKFRNAIENYFPLEKAAIRKYFKAVDDCIKQMPLYYASKALPNWMVTIIDLLRIGPHRWIAMTSEELLDKLNLSEKCRALLLAQWGYYGEVPRDSSFAVQAMVAKHFERGAYYPVGGAPSIAREAIQTIRNGGGEIAVRSTVEELIIEGNQVVGVVASHLNERFEFKSKKILSGISTLTLVNKILPKNQKELSWAKEVRTFHQSPPHVCLYVGMEGDVKNAGATRSSQWVFHTYNLNQKYWKFKDPSAKPPALFYSFPSVKDPAHVEGPTKRHTAEAVTFVEYQEFQKWSDSRRGFRPEEYQKMKAELEARMLAEFKDAFPALAPLIVHHEMSTPLSTEFFDRAPEGGIYGLEHTPRKFKSRAFQTRTPIKGLYLCASDVASGGVAGGLIGGFLAAATLEPKLFKNLV